VRWYIPPEGSHFQVKNETCQVSDDRTCGPDGGIVSTHMFDYQWLYLRFSKESDIYVQHENGCHGKKYFYF
jgi:hypothetical protein